MDLTKLSDSDLLALKSGDLSKLSDDGLMALSGKDSSIKNATKKYGAKDYARPFLSGMTFGLSDEIGAGMAALPAAIATGTNPIDAYKSMRDSVRGEQDQFSADNHAIDMAGNIVGALATGGVGGARLGATKLIRGMSRPVAKLATIGAAEGSLAGYGNSQSGTFFGDVGNTAKGGAIGGLLGGAVAPIGYAAKKVFNSLQDLGAAAKGPATQAARRLSQAMKQDGLTPQMLQRKMALLGKDAMPADVIGSGSQGYGILDEIANRPGDGAARIYGALKDRGTRYLGRVEKSVMDNVSPMAGKFNAVKQDIINQTSEAARPLYEAAYLSPVEHTAGMTKLLNNQKISSKLTKAASEVSSDLRLPDSVRKEAADYLAMLSNQSTKALAKPNIAMLDDVKRQFNDIAGRAVKANAKNVASKATNMANMITDELSAQGQATYKAARDVFSAGKKVEGALDAGRAAFKEVPEDTLDIVRGLNNEAERSAFRVGAGDAMRNTIRTSRETVQGNAPSVHNKIMGSLSQKDVLKESLDPLPYRRLTRDLAAEKAFKRTESIFGNSRTALRQQQAMQNLEPLGVVGDVANLANGNITQGSMGLIRRITNAVRGAGPNKDYDAQMVKMLLKPGELQNTLRLLRDQGSILPKWAQSVAGNKYNKVEKFLSSPTNRKIAANYLAGFSSSLAGQ